MNSLSAIQRFFPAIALSVCGVIVLMSGCQQSADPPETQTNTGSDPVSFFVSCDTSGWIVPCGCSAGQSGGLLRRASLIKQLTADTGGQSFVMDVGGAGAGTSTYHQMKFDAIVDGEVGMQLQAHNIGAIEASLGPEKLMDDSGKHFISANVMKPDGSAFVDACSTIVAKDKTFLVVGVMDPKFADENVLVTDPYQAILNVLDSHKSDGVIVLAYMERDALMELAGQLPEVDVILGGPTGQTIAPIRKGATLVMSATNKGKFIAHVCYRPDQSPRWSGAIVEVDDSFANDPLQIENLASFHRKLGDADFDSVTTGLKRQSQFQFVADLKYAGNAACVACHAQDCQQYAASKHAIAWETLVAKNSHVDPYCQQCHTTGYGAPSGFRTIAESVSLVNVGCESCHGPSMAHVATPKTRTPFSAKDQCVVCHDQENSPEFQYDEYWKKIIHGHYKDTPLESGQ